jgi:hypothetical protein
MLPKFLRTYVGTALVALATKVLHPESREDILDVALKAARERAKERFSK